MKTRRVLLAGLALLPLAAAGAASAQSDYPARPVRILVGVNAGGAADVMARTFAQHVGEAMKANFVVDNKPGAGGTVAADAAAKAAPDGYTLVAAAPTAMIVAPHLYRKLGYDPATDFAPIAVLGGGPLVLVASAGAPVRSVADVIALAKSRPGQVVYGSGGQGSAGHLTMEMFASSAGLQLVHVPYKGDGQAANDLLGGQFQIMFTAYRLVEPHVKSGKLRLLAVSSGTRPKHMPDVPTVAESDPSLAGFESLGWIGLFAPARTPPAIAKRLSDAWVAVRRMPDVARRFENFGMDFVTTASPEDFARFMQAERSRWAKVIAAAGVKPD